MKLPSVDRGPAQRLANRSLVVASMGLVLGLVASCGAVLKPPDPNRRLELVTRGSMFETSNGYKFVVLDDPEVEQVRVDVRYPVGSSSDPDGKEGLAHLVEHLLFEVEVVRPSGPTTITAELGVLATMSNAETTPDYTHYLSEGRPENLEKLLMLETERLLVGCKGLSQEVFEREREVVLNELRQRRGSGTGELLQTVYRSVYPDGHPYRRLDSLESVSKLSLDDACAFISEFYTRGPAIVVLSGKLDDASARYAVGGTLTRLPPRRSGAVATPPPVLAKRERLRVPANVKFTTVTAAWPLPARYTKEFRMVSGYERVIANNLAGFAARYKWGHSASYSIVGGEHAPIALVSVSVNAGSDLDEALEALGSSVRAAMPARLATKGVRFWEPTALSLLEDYEPLGRRAELYLDFVAHEPNGGLLAGRVEELRRIPAKELIELPRTWFDWDRAKVIIFEPADAAADGAIRAGSIGEGHAARRAEVDGTLADRPLAREVPKSLSMSTERYVTGNGLRVIMWPFGQVPVVRGKLLVSSGTAHEPKGVDGLAQFQRADGVGAETLVFADRELSIRVDDLVAYLGYFVRAPGANFSDETRERVQAALRRDDEQEWFDHELAVDTALYGEAHPYVRRGPTPASLAAIDLDRVKAWGRAHVVPANATLILAGHFDAALVKKHIAYQTDQVSKGSDSPQIDAVADGRSATIATVATTPMPTVRLHAAFVGARGVDLDEGNRRILRELLSERLMELRERLGVTYGFDAGYEHRHAGGKWWIGGEADAGRAGPATVAFVRILDDLRGDAESNRRAFVVARQRVLDQLIVEASTSESMLSRLTLVARFALDDDFFAELFKEVATTTLSDFQVFVRRELAADREVLSIFGNGPAVKAASAALRKE